MNNTRKFLIALALTAFAGVASAVPIVGNIAFSSETNAYWTPVDTADMDTTLAASTGIAFTAGDNGFDQNVVSGTGSFLGTTNAGADFLNFQFNPLTAGTKLWTFDANGMTYSLTMNAVTLLAKGSSTILLEGTGFMSIADANTSYDDTYGNWDFSGNTFSFSSSAAPEPAMVLLLATGLIGFGFARKARKSA